MKDISSNIIVILAGGSGSRYESSTPKQYTYINGVELIDYSISEMKLSEKADNIIVALNDDINEVDRVRKEYNVEVIKGGKDRAHSFQNAVDYINATYKDCQKVIFHEAARPLVKHDVIDKYFALLDEYDYVESCQKIYDSLGSYVIHAPRREDYYLIQAPEAYRFSVLCQYYDCESDVYFAANQFPEFVRGYQYFDIPNNVKLTKPEDKAVIEYLLELRKS